MFFYGHVFPKDVKLRAVTYLKLDCLKLVLDVEASDPCVSFCRRIESCEHRNESSLAGSIWTKKTKHFSLLDSQRKVLGSNFLSSTSTPWVDFSNIFDDKWILVVISLVEIVNNISLSFGIGVFKASLVVVNRDIVCLSVLLKIANLIVIVGNALGSRSTRDSLPSFGAEPVPLLRDAITLRDNLVEIPSESSINDGLNVE